MGHIPNLWLAKTGYPCLWLVTPGSHEGADLTPGVIDNESMDTRDESAETPSREEIKIFVWY